MQPVERTFESWDGTEIFYRAWIPEGATGKALLLFHRGHEHSGRWRNTVDSLGLGDVAIFAWDARGHGRSPGERGAADSIVDLVKDVNAFVNRIAAHHEISIENMIVLAHSLAAVVVTAWVHDYAPPIRAMILATAAFHVKLYVPMAIPALRLKQRIAEPGYVKSYVRSKMLTRDPNEAAGYDADPFIFRQISVNLLLDLNDTAKRLLADAGAIHTPTLMIAADRDWVVSLKAQQTFYERLSSPVKRMQVIPGACHAIFHDNKRDAVVDLVREFVLERFEQPAATPSLLKADESGYTWKEYEGLKSNGSARFAIARTALKAAGRLSRGIGLGWSRGFDSGMSLDYVYENIPQGTTWLGRAIDANYLNSIGWRGIRQRKANLEAALRRLIHDVHKSGGRVHILDVAAGTARYVVETIRALPEIPVTALLRDYMAVNVDIIQKDAAEFGLPNVKAEVGDAFDVASFASMTPRATIGIVSGLYELFPSNAMVMKSLHGLAEAIEPGGHLIYTNQPWHPQLEFIAHVLRNREGRPWIMRRRTTAEMDQLVREAGFEKIDLEVDRWGMFTVSVARRWIGRSAHDVKYGGEAAK